MNHDGKALAKLVESLDGVEVTEDIPYPVNKYTIFWEYFKSEVAKERIFFGAFHKWLKKTDPESPLFNKILWPYFLEGSVLTMK